MALKLAAITPVWNEPELIKGCVRSLSPYVDEHLVLVSQKPYYGSGTQDNTAEIAEECGATVIEGTWKLDHLQRNTGLALLDSYDWVITADADEMITGHNMLLLLEDLENTDKDAMCVNHYPYWRDYGHILIDDFKPVFAVRPSVKFNHIRNINADFDLSRAFIDHLSWCPPKDIKKKIETYAHADEFNSDIWYKVHYEGWKPGELAVFTNQSFQVKQHSFPSELKRLLQ